MHVLHQPLGTVPIVRKGACTLANALSVLYIVSSNCAVSVVKIGFATVLLMISHWHPMADLNAAACTWSDGCMHTCMPHAHVLYLGKFSHSCVLLDWMELLIGS